MSSDKIIQFPGARSTKVGAPAAPQPEGALVPPTRVDDEPAPPFAGVLSPDREKAIKLIMSGVSFILIGVKPAPTGADFFTALDGDATDLRNAESHLPEVIGRLYERKGLR